MLTTKNKKIKTYTPSVNIIRDKNEELNYIPTPNARLAFSQIINDCKNGTRSFNIVGAYGVGKSAFLWAFEKEISNEKRIFTSVKENEIERKAILPNRISAFFMIVVFCELRPSQNTTITQER